MRLLPALFSTSGVSFRCCLIEATNVRTVTAFMVIGLCLVISTSQTANASDWRSEAQQATTRTKSDPRGAAVFLIKCFQMLQSQPGASTDPSVKKLFLNDVFDIINAQKNQADGLALAGWEYAAAQKIFGQNSAYACLALSDMQSRNGGDLRPVVALQSRLSRPELQEFARMAEQRQAKLKASMDTEYKNVMDKLNSLKPYKP